MAKTPAKRPARKKKTAGKTTSRGKKRVSTPRKKASTPRKKASTARKKAAVGKKSAAGRKKKSTAKKTAAKKAKRGGTAMNLDTVQARLDKRMEKLTAQLDEMREFVQKELAKDLQNTRKYAAAEMEIQKRRFDRVLDKIRAENHELRSRMSKFVEEHEELKGVTKRVSDTAKSLEERVRKVISRDD